MEEIAPKGNEDYGQKVAAAVEGVCAEEGAQSGTTHEQTDDVIGAAEEKEDPLLNWSGRRGMTVQFACSPCHSMSRKPCIGAAVVKLYVVVAPMIRLYWTREKAAAHSTR